MSTNVSWPPIGGSTFSIPATGEVGWQALSNYLIALAGAQSTLSQKVATRTATTSPVTIVSATDCIVAIDLGTPGAVTVDLPAGVNGQYFCIVDAKGDAATNNITIDGNGTQTINGSLTYVINRNHGAVILGFAGSGNWVIMAEFSTHSSGTVARSEIAAGTPDYVVINGPTGELDQEEFLATSRGGFGVDASAFGDGVLKVASNVFSASEIVDADIAAAAAIDATKIADGSVTSTEFQYLGGVTSDIQTQIDGKQPLDAELTAIAGLASDGLIAKTAAGTMATRTATAGSTKITISNGDGVSGNPVIDADEAQFDLANMGGNLPIASGGTGETTANDALNALLPAQTGQSGKVLQTNGTNTSWQTAAAGGLATAVISTTTAAVANTYYLCNTSGGGFTVTLPAGSTGDVIKFADANETWDTNNLTIAPATGEIIDMLNANDTLVCNVERGWVELAWNGTRWVFSSLASSAPQQATATFLGGVKGGTVPGQVSGSAIAAGYIGERITFTSRTITMVSANTWTANSSALGTLTAGIWLVFFTGAVANAAAISTTAWAVATNNSNNSTGFIGTAGQLVHSSIGTSGQGWLLPGPTAYVNVSSSTDLYAKGYDEDNVFDITISGYAVRIA